MTAVWSGLALGAVYAVVAIGYNIAFAASGAFNFAQASFVMLGVYTSYWLLVDLDLPLVVAMVLAAVMVLPFGLVVERVAVRPVRGVEPQFIATVGAAVLLDGLAHTAWGDETLQLPTIGPDAAWTVLGGSLVVGDLVLILAVLVLGLTLELVSRRTLIGLASLAMAENRELATLRGINVNRFTLAAFGLSAAIAGALGPIVGAKTYAYPSLATSLALIGFVAFALGGFGSIVGSTLGGFATGVVQAVTVRYAGNNLRNLAVLLLLLMVLLSRPAGALGHQKERAV